MCYTQHLSQNSCGFSCHDRNVTTKCLLPDFFKNLPFSFGDSNILFNFANWILTYKKYDQQRTWICLYTNNPQIP